MTGAFGALAFGETAFGESAGGVVIPPSSTGPSGAFGGFTFGESAFGAGATPPGATPPDYTCTYDLLAVIDTLAPGVVPQRAMLDALAAAWAANSYAPLTQAQVIAVTGPLPAPLTSIPRMEPL